MLRPVNRVLAGAKINIIFDNTNLCRMKILIIFGIEKKEETIHFITKSIVRVNFSNLSVIK